MLKVCFGLIYSFCIPVDILDRPAKTHRLHPLSDLPIAVDPGPAHHPLPLQTHN